MEVRLVLFTTNNNKTTSPTRPWDASTHTTPTTHNLLLAHRRQVFWCCLSWMTSIRYMRTWRRFCPWWMTFRPKSLPHQYFDAWPEPHGQKQLHPNQLKAHPTNKSGVARAIVASLTNITNNKLSRNQLQVIYGEFLSWLFLLFLTTVVLHFFLPFFFSYKGLFLCFSFHFFCLDIPSKDDSKSRIKPFSITTESKLTT